MAELFSKPTPQPAVAKPPSIDNARETISTLSRARLMRGRAASMLARGGEKAPVAKRKVMGN